VTIAVTSAALASIVGGATVANQKVSADETTKPVASTTAESDVVVETHEVAAPAATATTDATAVTTDKAADTTTVETPAAVTTAADTTTNTAAPAATDRAAVVNDATTEAPATTATATDTTLTVAEKPKSGVTEKEETAADLNMYKFKNNLLFNRKTLGDNARMGRVGLPRVLNMYEDYPFWHKFFTSLGFDVVLSGKSDRKMYEKGISSISSETACYPAKLAHGHIEDLAARDDLDLIFYPAIFYEYKQFDKAQNHMNCPVVSGYPDVIKNNVENLEGKNFMNPYLSLESEKIIADRLVEEFDGYTYNGIVLSKKEIKNAATAAWKELQDYHDQIKIRGKEIIDYVNANNLNAIVLAGRPYHIDPEVNHGIPELIEGMKIPVISEDAVAYNIEDVDTKVRVLDQWSYHARLYRAAEYVADNPNLQLIQLNSFGCGLDAVTTDQVQDLLEAHGKIYTLLKIDEVSNLGAIKIRIRSLLQALNQKKMEGIVFKEDLDRLDYSTPEFTKQMVDEGYTILAPQMAREHFRILAPVFHHYGMNIEFLDSVNDKVLDQGLKYVNNDSCYPSITVVGQFMEAVNSGRYDTNKLAIVMTQTGGACRASNYVGYIRKGLRDAGYPNIPVIALSAQGIETNAGFDLKK
ncbi:MAG: acyl-CoA dehydratase activase-related protein, partial [Anaerococcus sp.]|uniref:acyl-CoA dehydratase activase-related protein n=1 Tax=Anaerococcus sp. TaxID=1872515 RepID=UPI0028FE2173